jgi:superfamily II DNA or RNA helicase
MIELRPYQEECVRLVLEAFEKDRSGYEIIVIPTGGGKTVCFGQVANDIQKKHGGNVLIIAHREELISQAADKYRMIRPEAIIGKVGSGVHEYGCEVTVASIQTICRPNHIEKLQSIGFNLIVVDEAHHIASKSYQDVLKALPEAFVLGVTATPDRLDKKDILKGKQPLFSKNIIDMVQEGYLCNFKAIAIQTHVSLDSVNTSMGDFNEGELNDAVNTAARNNLIVQKYREHTDGKRAACFCVTIAHADALCDAFNESGVPASVIKGTTPIEERKRIYHDFHIGKILILCTVMVCTEGWDEPLVEVIILARPTQSAGLFKQMFGRGLRLAPGKKECILLDITDNCLNHRLSPQNLKKAIVKHLNDNETLLEAMEREKVENEERQIQIRKLKEKRLKDIHIDLFEKLEWKELPNGVYLLEIGPERHKIALSPSKSNPELYYVQFKRAPYNSSTDKATLLSENGPVPIDWAQQTAESHARKIIARPDSVFWIDKVNPSKKRFDPITEAQKKMMDWKKIPHHDEMTKGEASDLIQSYMDKKEKEKAAKQARKDAKAIEA